MKIAVFGSNGFLGKKICKVMAEAGHEVCGSSVSDDDAEECFKADITDSTDVRKFFDKHSPDVAVNCAAITDVDWCEEHPEESMKVNFLGVKNLADACRESNAKFIHFSSGFVFDGSEGCASEEGNPRKAINKYGEHKLLAEEYIEKNLKDFLILRTIVLYGCNDKTDKINFVSWVLGKLKEGKQFNVVDDQFTNPTLIDDVANAVRELLEKNCKGIFHAVGEECLSRFEFAKIIAAEFGFDAGLISPISSKELSQKAARPKHLCIGTGKIRKEGITLSMAAEGLQRYKKQLKSA